MAGGWGVAALAGTQSRDHRDLDLAVDADDLSDCLQTLEGLGYQRETDWLPVRVEYAVAGRPGSAGEGALDLADGRGLLLRRVVGGCRDVLGGLEHDLPVLLE